MKMMPLCDSTSPMDTFIQRTIRMQAIRADLKQYLDREPTPDEVRRGYVEYNRAEALNSPLDVDEWIRVAVGEPS